MGWLAKLLYVSRLIVALKQKQAENTFRLLVNLNNSDEFTTAGLDLYSYTRFMPCWTDLCRTVKQRQFEIKVEFLVAPSIHLWHGWTYIHMQILLALFVSQLAREARLGNRDQIFHIQLV